MDGLYMQKTHIEVRSRLIQAACEKDDCCKRFIEALKANAKAITGYVEVKCIKLRYSDIQVTLQFDLDSDGRCCQCSNVRNGRLSGSIPHPDDAKHVALRYMSYCATEEESKAGLGIQLGKLKGHRRFLMNFGNGLKEIVAGDAFYGKTAVDGGTETIEHFAVHKNGVVAAIMDLIMPTSGLINNGEPLSEDSFGRVVPWSDEEFLETWGVERLDWLQNYVPSPSGPPVRANQHHKRAEKLAKDRLDIAAEIKKLGLPMDITRFLKIVFYCNDFKVGDAMACLETLVSKELKSANDYLPLVSPFFKVLRRQKLNRQEAWDLLGHFPMLEQAVLTVLEKMFWKEWTRSSSNVSPLFHSTPLSAV